MYDQFEAPYEGEDLESVRRLLNTGPALIRDAVAGPLFEYPRLGTWNGPRLNADIVALDFETTGLSPKLDRVIEVGLARLDSKGNLVSQFDTLINPGLASVEGGVRGLAAADFDGAPRFEDVHDTICEFLDGAIVVAHNAPFDEWFLGAECVRAGLPLPRNPAIDTLWLSKKAMYHPNRNTLGRVAERVGVDPYKPHTALGDVWTMLDVVQAILARGPQFRWTRPFPLESRVPSIRCLAKSR